MIEPSKNSLNLKEISKKASQPSNEQLILNEFIKMEKIKNNMSYLTKKSYLVVLVMLLGLLFSMMEMFMLKNPVDNSKPKISITTQHPKKMESSLPILELASSQKLTSREVRDMAESKAQKLFTFDSQDYKRQIVNMDENFVNETMDSYIDLLAKNNYLENLKSNGGYKLEATTDVPTIQSISYNHEQYVYEVDVPVKEKWIPRIKSNPIVEKNNIVHLILTPNKIRQDQLLISDISLKENK